MVAPRVLGGRLLGHWLDRERFLAGTHCTKRLWWSVRDGLTPEASAEARLRRDERARVLRAALARLPDAVPIGAAGLPDREALQATAEALADPTVRRIAGAAFLLGELAASVDLLERRKTGFAVVRVADGPQIEPRDVLDLAYQLHVVRACGVAADAADLLVLDRNARHPHLAELFSRRDVTARVEMLLAEIPALARSRVNLLHGPLPTVETGAHCREPWPCRFLARCEASGEPAGRGPREAEPGEGVVVEPGLARALRLFERPMAFVDVVAVRPAIPVWPGAHPWDETPALFGAAFEHVDGTREERGVAIAAADDPWETLADAWIAEAGRARQLVVYGAAEIHRHLEDLQGRAPHRATPLVDVRRRILDLRTLVRDHVHVPGLGDDLEIEAVSRAFLREPAAPDDARVALAQWVGDFAELGDSERSFLRSGLEETAVLRARRLAALMVRLREIALSPARGAGRASDAERARRGWIDPAPRAPRITPPEDSS